MDDDLVVTPIKPKKMRIFELDFVRGILILAMLAQHFGYFCAHFVTRVWHPGNIDYNFYKFGWWCRDFMDGDTNKILMAICLGLFFLMAGITMTFSRHNYRRSACLLGIFAVLYLTTYLWKNFFYEYTYMVGFDMIFAYALYIFLWTLINKFPVIVHMVICFVMLVLFILFSFVFPSFSPHVNPLNWFGVSRALNITTTIFRFFPSIFFFSFGVVIGKLYYKDRRSPLKSEKIPKPILLSLTPITFPGRFATIIYAAQAILYPLAFYIATISIG